MGYLIGYARVSTADQDLSLQLEALRHVGCRDAWIFRDVTSGARTARPGLEACLRALDPGDSRLLTNCIIYSNATILSQLLTHKERLGDVHGVAQLTQVSPVAWQHINLCGRYEFTKEPETINLEAIIQALAEVQITPEEFASTL